MTRSDYACENEHENEQRKNPEVKEKKVRRAISASTITRRRDCV